MKYESDASVKLFRSIFSSMCGVYQICLRQLCHERKIEIFCTKYD